MNTKLYKASSRGHADYGWLNTYHTFSFADYYDVSRMEFGALRVLNDDVVQGGKGFGMHPHRNMEIISIPLSGVLGHKDTMGNIELIKPGEIQLMSAGTGIYHREMNHNKDEDVRFFQIWVYPNEENTNPTFQKMAYDDKDKNILHQIVSPESDLQGLNIRQDAWLNIGTFEKDNKFSYEIHKEGNGLFAMVIEGEFELNSEKLTHRDALGIWDVKSVELTPLVSDSRILLIEVPMS